VGTKNRPDTGRDQRVVTDELVARLVDGDKRALTRILTFVENDHREGRQAMKALFARTGRAHIIGMTGPTGCGKSTLVGALAREYRTRGRTVGIVAVDPTSPFSHGAVLGDRVRMQELTSDPGVFIRSMATRGALGGLAPATNDVVTVMDAAHKDVIIVETVGAGQDEVDVADTAHTTIVISVPGAGDEVQAIKAGILEIADILVVNKADQPRADMTARQLAAFLTMGRDEGWEVPILQTVALKGRGVVELADAIERHRVFLETSGRLEEARRHRARRQLLALAQGKLLARVLASAEAGGQVERLVEAIARREVDPHTAAERLIEAAE
jgi:LAO/AO transport system kinase